ncbi:MAG: hypothetical protein AB8G14_02035 [Ilumatobacter sp.]
MAVLPYALRPAVIIRRKAIRQGLLGPSMFWKIVAGWVFGKTTIKKFFGKNDESLGTWTVGSNKFVNVINAKPPSKKERKAMTTTPKQRRAAVIARAVADTQRSNPDAKIVVKAK